MVPLSIATSTTTLISSYPIEWIVIGIFICAVAAESYRYGPARTNAFVTALVLAMTINAWLSTTIIASTIVQQLSSPIYLSGVFLVLFAVLYFCLYRMYFAFSGGGNFLQAIVCGVGAGVVLIAVWLQVPSLESMWHLNTLLQTAFDTSYRALWLLASFAALAFASS